MSEVFSAVPERVPQPVPETAPETVSPPVPVPVPVPVPESVPVPEPGRAGTHRLLEIAGLLEQGRLDGDIGTMARVPRSHAEVSAAVVDFARAAHDRGRDVAALLTALSTLLGPNGANGTSVEAGTAAKLKDFVDSSAYAAPKGS